MTCCRPFVLILLCDAQQARNTHRSAEKTVFMFYCVPRNQNKPNHDKSSIHCILPFLKVYIKNKMTSRRTKY